MTTRNFKLNAQWPIPNWQYKSFMKFRTKNRRLGLGCRWEYVTSSYTLSYFALTESHFMGRDEHLHSRLSHSWRTACIHLYYFIYTFSYTGSWVSTIPIFCSSFHAVLTCGYLGLSFLLPLVVASYTGGPDHVFPGCSGKNYTKFQATRDVWITVEALSRPNPILTTTTNSGSSKGQLISKVTLDSKSQNVQNRAAIIFMCGYVDSWRKNRRRPLIIK